MRTGSIMCEGCRGFFEIPKWAHKSWPAQAKKFPCPKCGHIQGEEISQESCGKRAEIEAARIATDAAFRA